MGATSSGRPTSPAEIASPYASRLNPSRRLMVSTDLDTVSRREGRPASELLRAHLEQRVPARRLGMPDEVARLSPPSRLTPPRS